MLRSLRTIFSQATAVSLLIGLVLTPAQADEISDAEAEAGEFLYETWDIYSKHLDRRSVIHNAHRDDKEQTKKNCANIDAKAGKSSNPNNKYLVGVRWKNIMGLENEAAIMGIKEKRLGGKNFFVSAKDEEEALQVGACMLWREKNVTQGFIYEKRVTPL